MNVASLQRADRWLGVPLCFLLTLVRAVFGRALPDCSRPPRSLLFVKLAEQGSTVLAYAALRRAVELAGRENVYFIALDDNRFILDLLGVLPEQNVITVASGSLPKLLAGALSAIRRLRALELDAAVDMEFFSRGSAALTYLSGARRRVGFHAFFGAGPYRGDLMSHRLLYNPHLHTAETFLSLVEALSRDAATLPTFNFPPPKFLPELPPFVPSATEVDEVKTLLRRETGACPPLVLLNPNASEATFSLHP